MCLIHKSKLFQDVKYFILKVLSCLVIVGRKKVVILTFLKILIELFERYSKAISKMAC